MTDLVNEFFRKHYPDDWKTSWETRYGGNGYHREYNGDRAAHSTIFPEMVCADGLRLSVQGHFGAYSHPRDDFADEYVAVEIMGPRRADELLTAYERDCNKVGEEMIYPYVPVSVVCAVIEKHGGLSAVCVR